jgi:hypothetical protein
MPAHDTPRQAAAELARLLATAVQQRQGKGTPSLDARVSDAAAGRMRHLIATLSADSAAVHGFFPALGRELKARGLRLPPLDQLPLPPELLPLLSTLDAALAPAVGREDEEIDHEAVAQRLNEQLGALLGESPRDARERVLRSRTQERVGVRVAAAMRKQGLVPLRDTSAGDDSFWNLVDIARRDHAAFVQRLGQLPCERLRTFYWEHVAAVLELRRAGLDAQLGPRAAEADIAALAAQIVASGYESHAAAVEEPARLSLGEPTPRVDLAADAARIFSERFGEPLAPGL